MNYKKILVGYTGFVGSNLVNQTQFDAVFNTLNINDAFESCPDLLIYAGIRAEKFLANTEPERDFNIILNAIENIQKIKPKRIVLISTVDVYPNPISVDEYTSIDDEEGQAYGKNRHYLEKWVEQNFTDYLIVRLPALFGKNLKKNFIYDLIHIVPSMLSEIKFLELSTKHDWLTKYYTKQENMFYKLTILSDDEKNNLKEKFLEINFSALNFTDSRAIFQFYNLNNLWDDINLALVNGIKKLNLATEPISANEIYTSIFNKNFENEILANPPHYDFYSIHSKKFGSSDKYVREKGEVLKDIENFIIEHKK